MYGQYARKHDQEERRQRTIGYVRRTRSLGNSLHRKFDLNFMHNLLVNWLKRLHISMNIFNAKFRKKGYAGRDKTLVETRFLMITSRIEHSSALTSSHQLILIISLHCNVSKTSDLQSIVIPKRGTLYIQNTILLAALVSNLGPISNCSCEKQDNLDVLRSGERNL